MGYVADGVIVVFVLIFVWIGVKRGFINSAARFLGTSIAAFLASALGGTVAQWVFDALFRDALVEKIGSIVAVYGTDNVAAAAESFFDSMPGLVQRAMAVSGITLDSVLRHIAEGSGQAAERIADALAPVFVGFLKVMAVILLFLLLVILVRVLANMLSSAFRLPILRQVNGLLGGLFGFLLAALALWVIVAAVGVFIPMLTAERQQHIAELLAKTHLLRWLFKIDALNGMFG